MHSKDDKNSASGSDKGSDGTTTGQSESNSSNKDKVENPQTNAAYLISVCNTQLHPSIINRNHIVC